MIKQLLSLASIVFIFFCLGAIFTQFVDVSSVWLSFEDFYHIFDNEGILEIESIPSGAGVYIDNKFIAHWQNGFD